MNPFQRIKLKIQSSQERKKSSKILSNRVKAVVQAFGESGREASILTPEVLEEIYNQIKQPDKNNYKTYAAQIEAIYKMYYNESDYGGELLRGLIDMQTAMLCGEGMNVCVFDSPEFLEEQKKQDEKKKVQQGSAKGPLGQIGLEGPEQRDQEEEITDEKKEQVETFIENFKDWNNLEGEGLIEMGECISKEGKIALVLNPMKKDGKTIIKVDIFEWYYNRYDIYLENGEAVKMTYTEENSNEPKTITKDRLVYMQFSGTKKDTYRTPPKVANVLTQIENYSRCGYDLRKNNHLFAKSFLWFETQNASDSNSIKKDLESTQFRTGRGGAGTGRPSIVSPTTGAADNIEKERVMLIKDIATAMSFPVFYLNYPELLSNRSVAETMKEAVNQGSKKDRLIFESGMKELIVKGMALAAKNNFEGAIYEPDMFEVNIPLITIDTLKQLIDVFIPLMDKKIVSKSYVQGKIPGINPADEEKQIEQETKENIMNNPIVQGTMNDVMSQQAQDKNIKQEKKNEVVVSR